MMKNNAQSERHAGARGWLLRHGVRIGRCSSSRDRSYFPAESSTAAGFISDRALSRPEAMASRAACRAKRRTNPSREEAAPRAFSSGAASDLSGSLEESVAMALSNGRVVRHRSF